MANTGILSDPSYAISTRTHWNHQARGVSLWICIYYGRGNWLRDSAEPEDLPKEFLYDLAVAVLSMRPSPEGMSAPSINSCKYHENWGDGSLCYRTHLVSAPKASVADVSDC